MKGKLALVIGAAAGYVMGAKAGTQRYEQIKAQADRALRDPKVQKAASQAQDLAKQKAPRLTKKASAAASKANSGASGGADARTTESQWDVAESSSPRNTLPEQASPIDVPATESATAQPPTAADPAEAPTPTPAAPQAGTTHG